MFLTLDDVLRVHASMIERYGGDGGILDIAKVESAIAQPQASFGGSYLHRDVFAMAAAYLFYLSKAHGFADGNKRVALGAAILFLEVNNIPFQPAALDELYQLTLDIVCNRKSKEDAAEYFRAQTVE